MAIGDHVIRQTQAFPGTLNPLTLAVPEGDAISEWAAWFSPAAGAIVGFEWTFLSGEKATVGKTDAAQGLTRTAGTFASNGRLSALLVRTTENGVFQLQLQAETGPNQIATVIIGASPADLHLPAEGGVTHVAHIPTTSGAQVDQQSFSDIRSVIYTIGSKGTITSCDISYVGLGAIPVDTSRRWIPKTAMTTPPARITVEGFDPDACLEYANQDVHRIEQDDTSLTVVDLDGTRTVYDFGGRLLADPHQGLPNLYTKRDDSRQFAVAWNDAIELHQAATAGDAASGSAVVFMGTLVPRNPYQLASGDSSGFDATFEISVRDNFDLFHLQGFNLLQLNPLKLLEGSAAAVAAAGAGPGGLSGALPGSVSPGAGGGGRIFRRPPSDSKEYHNDPWGGSTPVPNGVYRLGGTSSNQAGTTVECGSESDFQQSLAVGVKVEASLLGLIGTSNSGEFRKSVEQTFSAHCSATLTTGSLWDHDYAIDWSQVQFDEDENGFLDSLLRLAQHEADGDATAGNYDEFVGTYGTHYAYAIRFGAKYYYIRRYTSQEWSDKTSQGLSFDHEAHASLEGIFSAGVDVKVDTNEASGSSHEQSTEAWQFITVGGEPSKDGLTLGNKGVPILMDLRPITDLLNPVLFTGAASPKMMASLTPDVLDLVFGKVKGGIADAAARQHATASPFSTTDARPTVLEVGIQSLVLDGPFNDTSQSPDYEYLTLSLSAPAGVQLLGVDPQAPLSDTLRSFYRGANLPSSISDPSLIRRYLVQPGIRRDCVFTYSATSNNGLSVHGTLPLAGMKSVPTATSAPLSQLYATAIFEARYLGAAPAFQSFATPFEAALISSPMTIGPDGDLFVLKTHATGTDRVEIHGCSAASNWSDHFVARGTEIPLTEVAGTNFSSLYSVAVLRSPEGPRAHFFRKAPNGDVTMRRTAALPGNTLIVPFEPNSDVLVGCPGLSPRAAATVTPDGDAIYVVDPQYNRVSVFVGPNRDDVGGPNWGDYESGIFTDIALPTTATILAVGLYRSPWTSNGWQWDVAVAYRDGDGQRFRVLAATADVNRSGGCYTKYSVDIPLVVGDQETAFAVQTTMDQTLGGLFVITLSPARMLQVQPWAPTNL